MVILKWLNSVLAGSRPELVSQASAGHSSEEIKKREKTSSPVDLANAALVEHAEDLKEIINFGSSHLERKKLKKKIKKKVQAVLADEFNDPDIVEEVTERITDVAEIDPHYRNLFDRNAS